MSMDPEVVKVTGETTKRFIDVVTQELADDAPARVNEAAMEPGAAEVLEQERVDKAMRGEEAIDGLADARSDAEEEIETWFVGARGGSILRSTTGLRKLLLDASDERPEVHD